MSAYEFKGRFAIVTGAGSGIGLAVAEQLLQKGSSVILADLQLRPEAESMVARYPHPSIVPEAPVAVFFKTDVSDWAQLSALWEYALTTFKSVNIVANIAGMYESPFETFWKMRDVSHGSMDTPDASPGQYKVLAVNQVGLIRLSQIAVDYWIQNPSVKGNLLCMGSMASYLHAIDTPLYMASKAAVISFVRCLAELQDLFGIRVSAVCPGAVLTPMFEPEWNRKLTDEDIHLTPHECAAAILRVLQEPQWGKGSIVEIQKLGTKEASEIAVRDVMLEALYPTFAGANKHYIEHKRQFVARLREKGMRG